MTINSLIKAVEDLSSDIHVEVQNDVVRVRGSTYLMRGPLKLLGFRWDRKNREWYYSMPETDLEVHESDLFAN